MMGWRDKMGRKRARQKGLNFEREIATALRCVFPEAKRHLEFQFQEAHGIDLDNTGRFKIQCKKCIKYVSINTIFEIKYDELLGDVPVLVTAGDSQAAMAVLPFSDFVDLLLRTEKKN